MMVMVFLENRQGLHRRIGAIHEIFNDFEEFAQDSSANYSGYVGGKYYSIFPITSYSLSSLTIKANFMIARKLQRKENCKYYTNSLQLTS